MLKHMSLLASPLELMIYPFEFLLALMRYLFLMDEDECQNESTLENLRTLGKGNEVVVLSLGTVASLALSRKGVAHITPNLFFSKAKSPAMDKQAVEFCKEWHESIDNPLMSFHGVSIGEAMECDFYFFFIDAVRSVEIARTLLQDSFDTIFIPPPRLRDVKYSIHNICYDTLPSILTYLAGQKGITVLEFRRSPSSTEEAVLRRDYRKRFPGLFLSSLMFLLKNLSVTSGSCYCIGTCRDMHWHLMTTELSAVSETRTEGDLESIQASCTRGSRGIKSLVSSGS